MLNLQELRGRANALLAEYNHAHAQVTDEKTRLEEAKERVLTATQAQQLIQGVAQQIQQRAHDKIVAIVNRCLQAIFEDPYDFRIVFEKKRGKTEARLVFLRQDREIDPLTAAGLGVVDVAAFALRVACVMLSRPSKRRLLVLDEPMKMLSANHGPAVAQLLTTLTEELKMQILLVTHNPALVGGQVIEVE